jgi:hypothetical protein
MKKSVLRHYAKRLFPHSETGQALVILALGFAALLAFVGVVTDISLMFVRYTQLRRAVDAAAIAAAGQMRQDRDYATVQLAARQFIEFHGLDPVDVIVETCRYGLDYDGDGTRTELDDPELCPAGDQRKLVRVSAQVDSPTIFLKLIGWKDVRLESSAISETAVLDVVLVMDVSESMLNETTYEDWASLGLGTVFRPPTTEEIVNNQYGSIDFEPLRDLWVDLTTTSQQEVNNRLTFVDDPALDHADADSNYVVRSFDLDGYVDQDTPRVECTVRFAPSSIAFEVPQELKDLYDDAGYTWPPPVQITDSAGRWQGFRPTYDFYGCCNDPTKDATIDIDGTIHSGDPSGGDNSFEDLICQPFKQARDATRDFLQRVDFTRGDRVAFVTFGRSAYIINPYDVKARENGYSHMIGSFEDAVQTLDKFIGVRAEPNFYNWGEELTSADGGFAGWIGYSSGVDAETGDSVPVDYSTTTEILNDYPVKDHCPFWNVALPYPFTRYGDSSDFFFKPLSRYMIPNSSMTGWGGEDLDVLNSYDFWASCRDTNIGAALREANNALLDTYVGRTEGAVWIIIMLSDGAAGASDPVRRNGEMPIQTEPFVDAGGGLWGFQGDYGAFGVCPYGTQSNPLELVDNEMDGTDEVYLFPFCSDEEPETRHFCNFRPAQDEDGMTWEDVDAGARPIDLGGDPFPFASNNSEVITSDNSYVSFVPAPSQSPPFAVNCPGDGTDDPDCVYDLNGDGVVEDETTENRAAGHFYDVDIASYPDECIDYDVDDYARDWADFVGVLGDRGDFQLPTMFTIGFGLNFEQDSTGTPGEPGYVPGDPTLRDNIPDYLGEELLRYVADVGDNYAIDTDYQQDWLDEGSGFSSGTIDLQLSPGNSFTDRGPCENQTTSHGGDGIYDSFDQMVDPLGPTVSCGNYFNAPGEEELQEVFDEIASRMFTRLAG